MIRLDFLESTQGVILTEAGKKELEAKLKNFSATNPEFEKVKEIISKLISQLPLKK